MTNNRRKILTIKYCTLTVLFLLIYVLQSTPGLFSVLGVKPVLLIPAAITLAMYEGEFSGGLYGLLAGMLCDLGGFAFYGLYSVLLLVLAAAAGLLTIYLMRRTLLNALLMVLCTSTLCGLLDFYFQYGLWAYAGIGSLFLSHTLPTIVYTTVTAPLFFWVFGKLCSGFDSRINI